MKTFFSPSKDLILIMSEGNFGFEGERLEIANSNVSEREISGLKITAIIN